MGIDIEVSSCSYLLLVLVGVIRHVRISMADFFAMTNFYFAAVKWIFRNDFLSSGIFSLKECDLP